MKPIEVDKRSKFTKWDDKIGEWYMNLASTNKALFIIMFIPMLIGDLVLVIPRHIDKYIQKRKYDVK